MYHEFADKIEKDTEILKPRLQDSSKDTNKVNKKLNQDAASLKFNGLCIQNAKVSRFAVTNHNNYRKKFLIFYI